MSKIIFIISISFFLCFAKEEIPELTKANNYYKQDKRDEAIKQYKIAAKKGSAKAYFYLAYRYSINENYNFEQAAIRGDEEALEYFLNNILFRANFLNKNPKKAFDVYKKAKKINPNLKIFDEKEVLKVLKIVSKSNGFDINNFIKKYNLDSKKLNNEFFPIWSLAEEAAKGGRFGKPNPKLVFDLVVRGGNVPAEYKAAVIDSYKNWQKGIAKFNICDYITSGMNGSFCSQRYEKKEEQKSKNRLNKIKKSLNKENIKLIDDAYKSASAFIEKKALNEETHGGTGRVSWLINSEIEQKKDYIKLINKINKKFIPKVNHSFKFYDKKLNQVYKKVMKRLTKSKLNDNGMSYPITKNGVRTTQRLWIKYRDNSVKLFVKLNKKSKKELWLAYLTQIRISQLSKILSYE